MDTFQQRAVNMLTSTPGARGVRPVSGNGSGCAAGYGANFFGQSLLMARRLVEAGTRFVQVKWYDWDGAWDIHGFNSTGIERMEEELCPRFDQGLTACWTTCRIAACSPRRSSWSWARWAARRRSITGAAAITGARACSRCWPAAACPAARSSAARDAHAAYPATYPVYPRELAATHLPLARHQHQHRPAHSPVHRQRARRLRHWCRPHFHRRERRGNRE